MTALTVLLLAVASIAEASVSIADPGDYADLTADAADNTILADYTTDSGGPQYLIYNITGPYHYYDKDAALAQETLSVDQNDTSVVVVTEGSQVNLSYVTVVKEGYSTWLNQASFFGVNAAINVANKSTSYIEHSNITVHNGAANIYSYGTDTVVYVNDVDLYSSGPVSHGLYAAGNGTFYATNIRHYSGGNRASSFSGDTPGGYIHVTDAVAHTAGVGSAIFYALGENHGTNVVGKTENAPCLFSDGEQSSYFTNVDFTCGLLAGTILFSSATRLTGGYVSFSSSRLTTTGDDMAALWFGNIIASADITATEIDTASGILVIANSSQVTQAFDYFAGGEQNSDIEPAEAIITVSESKLTGDLVAYNGSSITWNLTDYSTWTGATVQGNTATTNGTFSIHVDSTSTWTLTKDSYVQSFKNGDSSLSNIKSQGYSIYYDASDSDNSWLDKKTVSLTGGGKAQPA